MKFVVEVASELIYENLIPALDVLNLIHKYSSRRGSKTAADMFDFTRNLEPAVEAA